MDLPSFSLLLLTFSAILSAGAYLFGKQTAGASLTCLRQKTFPSPSLFWTATGGIGRSFKRRASTLCAPFLYSEAYKMPLWPLKTRDFTHNGIDANRIGGALEDTKKRGHCSGRQHHFPAAYQKHNAYWVRPAETGEIMMAFKLEQYYTKDEILEMYLNTVYLWQRRSTALETAAHEYFGKSAGEPSLAEFKPCWRGTLKAPSRYSPRADMDNSLL